MLEPSVLHSSAAAESSFRAAPFECSCSSRGLLSVWVHAAGEVDMATAPQLHKTLREAQAAARLVVLDLRAVTFLDCSGIHVLLIATADARAIGGQLAIVRGSTQVQRVLALTGVERQVSIVDLDDAGVTEEMPRVSVTPADVAGYSNPGST